MTTAEPSVTVDAADRPRTVLVVDDQPDLCRLLEALLNSAGYRCRSCRSLPEALAVLAQERVDLILTDSFTLTRNDVVGPTAPLRWASRDTPVLLLTAHLVDATVAQAAGFAAVLAKPFDIDELLTCVAALLPTTAACVR